MKAFIWVAIAILLLSAGGYIHRSVTKSFISTSTKSGLDFGAICCILLSIWGFYLLIRGVK